MSTEESFVPRVPAAVLVMALATSACVASVETSDPGAGVPEITEATSTTATTAPSEPASTTTVPPTTSSAPPTGEPPVIHLSGSTVVFSQDGVIAVHGWLDRPAEVTVGSTPASVTDDPVNGLPTFDATLVLEPGEHAVAVTAADPSGAESAVILSVLVDPALEVRLAYLSDVDLAARTLLADDVEFLTGEAATAAAREDGIIAADEGLPGGFYLRNTDPALREMTVGDPWMVVLQACYPDDGPCVVEQAVCVDEWLAVRADPESAFERFGWHWYGLGNLPYRLILDDGVVVNISEIYLP
jgi:hypothetical protein